MAEKKSKPVDVEKLTFEEAMEQLEQIVAKVEAGETGLEESIGQYEVGCRLIRHCRRILEQAEQRIEVLGKGLDGEVEARPAGADLGGEDANESGAAEDSAET